MHEYLDQAAANERKLVENMTAEGRSFIKSCGWVGVVSVVVWMVWCGVYGVVWGGGIVYRREGGRRGVCLCGRVGGWWCVWRGDVCVMRLVFRASSLLCHLVLFESSGCSQPARASCPFLHCYRAAAPTSALAHSWLITGSTCVRVNVRCLHKGFYKREDARKSAPTATAGGVHPPGPCGYHALQMGLQEVLSGDGPPLAHTVNVLLARQCKEAAGSRAADNRGSGRPKTAASRSGARGHERGLSQLAPAPSSGHEPPCRVQPADTSGE